MFRERFNKGDEEAEMQNDVSNVLPKKAPTSDIFPEPFKNIDGEGEMQNDVFNIQPKKAPL